MYTNIDTTTGIASIRNFLHTNQEVLPHDFPITPFLDILDIAMKHNIFSWQTPIVYSWLVLSWAPLQPVLMLC